jgi:hypothetical protein
MARQNRGEAYKDLSLAHFWKADGVGAVAFAFDIGLAGAHSRDGLLEIAVEDEATVTQV